MALWWAVQVLRPLVLSESSSTAARPEGVRTMFTFLVIMHVFVSIFLILVVLLQTGKGSGMGAAFGGSAQTLFGSRGKSTPLQKITAVMAVLFMSLSIALASFSVSGRSALTEETAADTEAGIASE